MGSHLEELQRLDQEIETARKRADSFQELLDEVEQPALDLDGELGITRARLQEMKVDERRIELSADEKNQRVKKLEDRLNSVRNVREEVAVGTELDMIRQALEGDEQEALTLLDQIRKLEDRAAEQTQALAQARAELEPRRQELLDEQKQARTLLEKLLKKRAEYADAVDAPELRIYERIRQGGGRKAVARLTPDGACGHCFNVLPLQLQNEVRHGVAMIRCEACGVILTSSSEEGDPA
jgi:hypothetical protein